ncbi:hypothetical protein QFC19_001676 [Naganishia cerealis]|uniref:Uncharacterized protein n=1 Tax=Naganishia cerealis TaxID=610337 RepID=A0ACC2WEV6_9TREE|nr:hypothetical protein QFC19_001676 [Naganishia cerealis]
MAKDPTLKKKRKSEAMLEPAAPEEGSTSAQAVVAEVESEHAEKKAKKEKKEKKDKKKKDADGDVTMATEAGDVTVDDASKKEKKEKKEKPAYEVPADAITPIASPMASAKLQKKLLKTVKKSSRARQLKRGVKEVIKALRKGEQGLLVLAGNITPMDVISHLPLMAEEAKGVEYIWVTSKEELGAASGTKRATSTVLICSTPRRRPQPKDGAQAKPAPTAEEIAEWQKPLEECIKEVKELEAPKY